MKLTGMETPRDLEVLHYLATVGEIDQVIGRVKFGKTCRNSVEFLQALGHPITTDRTIRYGSRDRERWRWVGRTE